MDPPTGTTKKNNSSHKVTECLSFRQMETEFWKTLQKNLENEEGWHEKKINFKPLIKMQKTMNHMLMRFIVNTNPEPKKGENEKMIEETEAPPLTSSKTIVGSGVGSDDISIQMEETNEQDGYVMVENV